jgi:ribonuclease HII
LGEEFVSSPEQCQRVELHLDKLANKGITITNVRSEVICTGRLNQLKSQGIHRFAADLHAMERLILALRDQTPEPIEAVCGKVGGIGKYEPFFGPLAGRLHTAVEEGQARSTYYFPQLGIIHFLRDADASDPLVMLASMVGKYLRELLMSRIARFYSEQVNDDCQSPSGYHDPVTERFVTATARYRKQLKIVRDCFERRPACEG